MRYQHDGAPSLKSAQPYTLFAQTFGTRIIGYGGQEVVEATSGVSDLLGIKRTTTYGGLRVLILGFLVTLILSLKEEFPNKVYKSLQRDGVFDDKLRFIRQSDSRRIFIWKESVWSSLPSLLRNKNRQIGLKRNPCGEW
ncbi:hypothetical protein TNCV_3187841 [Trichonephila clavipes]|nr:hypothetical protein TNCV_3187841 [Trichonephila clavipes]